MENWVVGPKACYLFNDTDVSWNEARDSCRSFGGDLVSINDVTEDDFVVSHLAHVDGKHCNFALFLILIN